MILLFIRLCIYVQLLVSSLSSIWSDKIYFHRLSFLGDFTQMFAIILLTLFCKNTFGSYSHTLLFIVNETLTLLKKMLLNLSIYTVYL